MKRSSEAGEIWSIFKGTFGSDVAIMKVIFRAMLGFAVGFFIIAGIVGVILFILSWFMGGLVNPGCL